MLYVLIGFDYELFLGKNNATYDDVLFKPTSKILSLLKEKNAKATFFADECSHMFFSKHKSEDKEDFVSRYEKQIQEMIGSGQGVELHVHSNWLKSSFDDNGELCISEDGYRIHDYGFGENGQAGVIIKEAKEKLENLCQKADNNYKISSFRAGGFCLQPEKEYLSCLLDNGVYIDSSITPHLKSPKGNASHYFNYSKVPHRLNWNIDPSLGVNIASDVKKGTVFEVPIMTTKFSVFRHMFLKRREIVLPPNSINGSYIGNKAKANKRNPLLFLGTIWSRAFKYRTVSLDSQKADFIYRELLYLSKKAKGGDAFVSIIGHPKLFSETRLENLSRLIDLIKSSESLELATFSDLSKRFSNRE